MIKSFGKDDYIMLATQFCFTFYLVCQLGSYHYGIGLHRDQITLAHEKTAKMVWYTPETIAGIGLTFTVLVLVWHVLHPIHHFTQSFGRILPPPIHDEPAPKSLHVPAHGKLRSLGNILLVDLLAAMQAYIILVVTFTATRSTLHECGLVSGDQLCRGIIERSRGSCLCSVANVHGLWDDDE